MISAKAFDGAINAFVTSLIIVAICIFVVGFGCGYFGRPYIESVNINVTSERSGAHPDTEVINEATRIEKVHGCEGLKDMENRLEDIMRKYPRNELGWSARDLLISSQFCSRSEP